MDVQRTLIDKDFDRYVLSLNGVQKKEDLLKTAVLDPLQAINKTRKAQWDTRIHYNALTSDHYLSDLYASVAYFVNSDFQLMQVIASINQSSVMTRPIHQFATCVKRKDNVSLEVAGKDLLVYCDGSGTLSFLKLGHADARNGACEVLYECTPVGIVPLLLLKATYDEVTQSFHTLMAETLEGVDQEASFRLWAMAVSCAVTSDSMDVDSGFVGLQHDVFEVALIESIPAFISFCGSDMIILLEGNITPTIEMQANWNEKAIDDDQNHTTKRHHEDSEQEEDNEQCVKLPRAGIGYHGDISDIKHSHEGLSLDMSESLESRFQKSSLPFSSLDEPLHNTSSNAVPNVGKLEVPTPETILGGFEECDDFDPNAKAVLLLVNMTQKVVQDKFDINCRSFRYLCASSNPSSLELLFQHDVHGLVFTLDIVASRLKLTHTNTFPAFGFVQASKQDKKLMMFEPSANIACIAEFEKRIFVYHGDASDQEKLSHTRKQHVIEIGDHQVLGMRIIGSSVLLLTAHHVQCILGL